MLTLDVFELALGGGEDYALLITSPSPVEGFTKIGEVTVGEGVILRDSTGDRAITGGFDHFT